MNITRKEIKKLIKEELDKFSEADIPGESIPTYTPDPDKYNREGSMARSQLFKASNYADTLTKMFDDQTDLPEWVEAKITKAADYLGMVKHYMEGEAARDQGELEENVEK